MTAWINAIIGSVALFALGTLKLGLSELDALLCIAGSNAAGMLSLLVYTFGNHLPWTRRHLFSTWPRTWAVFLFTYFGALLVFAPALRAGRNFAWLILPAILTTGFCILLFGPLQDGLVRRAHRRN